jgi:enamine deaminase RidA (YjgF/YER057c/UK114 family)
MNQQTHHSNPSGIHPPAGQYSHGVSIQPGATVLHVAGQVGAAPDGSLEKGFEAQVHRAFSNLRAVLADHRMTVSDLVRVNYFLVNPGDIDIFRIARARHLPDPPPASTTLLVPRLMDPTWLFEIDAVAARA